MVERLYHIVPWLGGVCISQREGGCASETWRCRPQSASGVYVNAVRALLEEHLCWTCIELAREVGIAPGTILHILKKLQMSNICAQRVPHNLKEENMWQKMETVRLPLERYGREGERFLRLS